MKLLTFRVKSVLQAANLLYETLREHRGCVILTNLATVPGYQLVFYTPAIRVSA
ncbi:hypothetical protein [Nostoc sp.]|uniref:hypothetical protein n=1 Tax=Nostoc sp. TaxID=1180 RepID=UPI002FF666FD